MRNAGMQSKQELPHEKLNRKGAEVLADIELLQAVISSGGKNNDFTWMIVHEKPYTLFLDELNACA
jgi:DNA repair protein RadC